MLLAGTLDNIVFTYEDFPELQCKTPKTQSITEADCTTAHSLTYCPHCRHSHVRPLPGADTVRSPTSLSGADRRR